LLQRIREARVRVRGEEISKAGPGLCLFLGVGKGDTRENARYLAEKAARLRVFEDEAGKFDRSLLEVQGEVLVVAEFTLYGDCTKGRRPSFSEAAGPEEAQELYQQFVRRLEELGLKVGTGRFQAKMEVSIINDGPVTFVLENP